MTDTYRLFVELPNGAKFRAHGEVGSVRVDAERFYELLLNVQPPAAPSAPATPLDSQQRQDIEPTELPGTLPLDLGGDVSSTSLPRLTIERLFAKDRNGTVSLRALPQGEGAESNAIIALIYGSMTMGGEPQVTGSRLMKAAVQSGLQVDRIDRTLTTAIGPYVTTAGFKKGRKYGLTNPGIRKAEDVLRAILN